MKKKISIEFYHLVVVTVSTLLMVCFLCYNGVVFGSTVDWMSQHTVIPDYFRNRFYETGDLISQFAMNYGAGQNAFNFTYHGYLNPIILISYLLPFVSMKNYVIGASIAVILITLYLFYFWLLKKNISNNIAFCTTLLFLFSTSFFYHSHKQVMFMWYMPFLMMALMGVDRMFEKKKRGLLVVSVFLMFMTNYYFSVSGILILSVYAIYQFMTVKPDFTLKDFLKAAGTYALALINSALLTAFALYPTFLTVMNGRHKSEIRASIDAFKLIIPGFSIINIMYSPYGMGLTVIALVAIISFLVSKKKNKVFLSTAVLVLMSFPFITYALNMFLYNNSKIYMCFIPVVLMMTAMFLEDVFTHRLSVEPLTFILTGVAFVIAVFTDNELVCIVLFAIDFIMVMVLLLLSKKCQNKLIFFVPVLLLAAVITFAISTTADIIKTDVADEMYNSDKKSVVCDVLKDEKNIYRSNDLTHTYWTCNYIYSDNFFQTGIYSSVYNKQYNYFTHHTINLTNMMVNDIATANANDWLFDRFMGVKYILADKTSVLPRDYKLVKRQNDYAVYENKNVYSVLFGSDKLMSLREYESLSTADKEIAILGYIVVDDDELKDTYVSPLSNIEPEFKSSDVSIDTKNFKVGLDKDEFITADVSGLQYDSYIVEITLKDYPKKKSYIAVNGIYNGLSSTDNAFPKSNMTFSYVVTANEKIDNLNIHFYEGDYSIQDINCYGFNSKDINLLSENITKSSDVKLIDDNIITGTITMENDGYINLTIPYEKGFKLFIDDKEVPCEQTDSIFIGAYISKGTHNIRLEYNTPGLKFGIIVSCLGVLLLAGIIIKEYYETKNYRRSA